MQNSSSKNFYNFTTAQKIYMPFKRLISFFGSIVGIVVCLVLLWWWVFPINFIVTKGHPVFAHHRIGRNRKAFRVLKFRSMSFDTDPHLSSRDDESLKQVTKFGKFLRKTSIDETLQLFNILVGQMAFIGPRPLIDLCDDKITIEKRKENGSISLRPGLSGYAQLRGREELDPIAKAQLDGYYLEHFSLWMDIKLFVKTIFNIIAGGLLSNSNLIFAQLSCSLLLGVN